MLAGGHSSRMGRDKAQLMLDGTTLLEHALATLREGGFVAGVAGLAGETGSCTAPVVRDNFPSNGPLGGMEAALALSPGERVLFVPVDLPLLPAVFMQWLWRRAESTGAEATVPLYAGLSQPLCGVYAGALAPRFAQALGRGERKVMRVLEQSVPAARFDRFAVESLAPMEGWAGVARWFNNVNTPADWDALLASDVRRAEGSIQRIFASSV